LNPAFRKDHPVGKAVSGETSTGDANGISKRAAFDKLFGSGQE
jgi:hypothetical protein